VPSSSSSLLARVETSVERSLDRDTLPRRDQDLVAEFVETLVEQHQRAG